MLILSVNYVKAIKACVWRCRVPNDRENLNDWGGMIGLENLAKSHKQREVGGLSILIQMG